MDLEGFDDGVNATIDGTTSKNRGENLISFIVGGWFGVM